MATTIDVVPLDLEKVEPEKADILSESSKSENNESPKSKKRGRPAGAKDLKPRKTPARQKKTPQVSKEALSSQPALEEAPPIEQPVMQVQPMQSEAASPKAIPKATPELSPFQRSRMRFLESQSAHQSHWDGIIQPMFRFPIY